jgi:hypothetical protein
LRIVTAFLRLVVDLDFLAVFCSVGLVERSAGSRAAGNQPRWLYLLLLSFQAEDE